jgi:hypothetical protein
MQVQPTRQDILQQMHEATADRKVSAAEFKTLQDTLAGSGLPEAEQQALGKILTKIGEFTQSEGDGYLSEPEMRALQTLAASLESPAATRMTEEIKTSQTAAVAVSGNSGTREAGGKRSFFQAILDAIKAVIQWFASLFGGGDKNNVQAGRGGSALSSVALGDPDPQTPAQLPDWNQFDAQQDYSAQVFQNQNYLQDYARPQVPAGSDTFNNYLSAVPSSLRVQGGDFNPANGVVSGLVGQPGAPTSSLTGETSPTGQTAPASPAPAATRPNPNGVFYQRSPYHDESKFVPRHPMAAFHESGVYRRQGDPYAVGAISKPRKGDDLGGKTYGTYQFESSVYIDGSSRNGKGGAGSTLSRFINDPGNPFGPPLKAAAQKHGLASQAFDALWTKFSREYNQAFGQAQEDFALKDKADNVQRFMELAQFSPEVRQDPRIQDLVMGTTNHVGNLADGAARYLARLQQQAGRALNANEIGKALAEYKESKISSWFVGSPGAHVGLANRFEAEARVFS